MRRPGRRRRIARPAAWGAGAALAGAAILQLAAPAAARIAPAPAARGAVTIVAPRAAPHASQTQASQAPAPPRLVTVLARATAYVDDLHARLTGVVMEERYEQRASAPSGFGPAGRDGFERVTLRSDYLLVRPAGTDRPFGFRDVFEANGRTVRDRTDRLTALFLDPDASVNRRIQGILTESARYNVGDVERNTNTPTLALLFLGTSFKPRFAFERAADDSPGLGVDGPDRAHGAWVIGYEETWPTTVIRRRGGRNLPARGRYWIDPATGRVLVSELILDSPDLASTITVRYAEAPGMDHPVPVEMRERYHNRLTGSRVDGAATYTSFRRFRVQVDESPPFRD